MLLYPLIWLFVWICYLFSSENAFLWIAKRNWFKCLIESNVLLNQEDAPNFKPDSLFNRDSYRSMYYGLETSDLRSLILLHLLLKATQNGAMNTDKVDWSQEMSKLKSESVRKIWNYWEKQCSLSDDNLDLFTFKTESRIIDIYSPKSLKRMLNLTNDEIDRLIELIECLKKEENDVDHTVKQNDITHDLLQMSGNLLPSRSTQPIKLKY